ncbi:hypothetical protein NP493_464g01002 [Ridgeia piscesae]|uniref:Uncharacterized protein n=1 Tax=Ridgeia piscesae TaxID=27915 RepID=A0AAD9KYX8_RIDPI|nr:hypothetical protein NP493_464g01002 [Ridgeia piscesae]
MTVTKLLAHSMTLTWKYAGSVCSLPRPSLSTNLTSFLTSLVGTNSTTACTLQHVHKSTPLTHLCATPL